MIKIGDFARFSQVSIATLRHYDELGLLKPISVDPFTGYRYYSVSQLPRLNRLLALKDLGFSLEQINQVLNNSVTLDQLRGMLMMKHAEVEQQLAQEQTRLDRIAARLKQIELEDTMPNYEVILKTIPGMLIASQRITIPTNGEVPVYLGTAYREVFDYLKLHGLKEVGPTLAIWHQPAEVRSNEEAEAAVPIDHTVAGTDRVKVYDLPAVQVASAVHHGAFENFRQVHLALLKWIEENKYQIVGPYREVYINHGPNMDEAATEIQYPVEKD